MPTFALTTTSKRFADFRKKEGVEINDTPLMLIPIVLVGILLLWWWMPSQFSGPNEEIARLEAIYENGMPTVEEQGYRVPCGPSVIDDCRLPGNLDVLNTRKSNIRWVQAGKVIGLLVVIFCLAIWTGLFIWRVFFFRKKRRHPGWRRLRRYRRLWRREDFWGHPFLRDQYWQDVDGDVYLIYHVPGRLIQGDYDEQDEYIPSHWVSVKQTRN